MKITSNLSKCFLKCTNEAIGVNLDKQKILKKKKNTTYTYSEHSILILIVILLIATIFALLGREETVLLSIIIVLLAFLYVVTNVLTIIILYNIRKKAKLKNSIVIDKEGITDISYYDIKMTFSWDKIKAIVKRAHTIVILTDTPCYFYFPKSKYRSIVKEVKKYKEDILIIE